MVTLKKPAIQTRVKKLKSESKKPSAAKLSLKTPMKKSEIVAHLSEVVELPKQSIIRTFDAMADLVGAHLGKKGPGEINFAGLFKCRVVHKAATKEREGKDPFTGKIRTFSAKPARSIVRIRPLKKLKEIVN